MKLQVLDTGPAPGLGWHRIGAMMLCPAKYAYENILHLPRPPRAELAVGSALHVALAHHYTKILGSTDAIYVPHDAIDAWWDENVMPQDKAVGVRLVDPPETVGEDRRPFVHALFNDYLKAYPPSFDRDYWTVLAVEVPLLHTIGGIPHGQRADLVVEYQHKVWIVDHKTMGGSGIGGGVEQFTMSGQMIGYQALGNELWPDNFGGVLINAIEKRPPTPGHKRFWRKPVPSAPDAVKRFARVLEDFEQLKALYADRDPLDYPRVLDQTVCNAYRGCDYLPRCRWGTLKTNGENANA